MLEKCSSIKTERTTKRKNTIFLVNTLILFPAKGIPSTQFRALVPEKALAHVQFMLYPTDTLVVRARDCLDRLVDVGPNIVDGTLETV